MLVLANTFWFWWALLMLVLYHYLTVDWLIQENPLLGCLTCECEWWQGGRNRKFDWIRHWIKESKLCFPVIVGFHQGSVSGTPCSFALYCDRRERVEKTASTTAQLVLHQNPVAVLFIFMVVAESPAVNVKPIHRCPIWFNHAVWSRLDVDNPFCNDWYVDVYLRNIYSVIRGYEVCLNKESDFFQGLKLQYSPLKRLVTFVRFRKNFYFHLILF